MDQSGTSSHWFAVFGRQWAIFGTFADQACSSPTFATVTQTAHPGQRKPPNVQTTNPFGHQCMARHHGALQGPMQGTWFGPQIWRVGQFAHSTAVSPLLPRLAAPAHLAQEQKWQNQPKCCATTLWGGNLAVVWGSGSQQCHGRFERYDKIGKMPLKKKTLDLATNSQK